MSGKSLNKVRLIGNLTRDVELKYTPSGTGVATIGLATNRSWITATGETKDEVQYHRLVAWQKLAELAAKILSKGRKIYCEGRLVYRAYTSKDGVEKNITEIVIDDFIVLDAKPSTTSESNTTHEEPATHEAISKNISDTITDDDIPF